MAMPGAMRYGASKDGGPQHSIVSGGKKPNLQPVNIQTIKAWPDTGCIGKSAAYLKAEKDPNYKGLLYGHADDPSNFNILPGEWVFYIPDDRWRKECNKSNSDMKAVLRLQSSFNGRTEDEARRAVYVGICAGEPFNAKDFVSNPKEHPGLSVWTQALPNVHNSNRTWMPQPGDLFGLRPPEVVRSDPKDKKKVFPAIYPTGANKTKFLPEPYKIHPYSFSQNLSDSIRNHFHVWVGLKPDTPPFTPDTKSGVHTYESVVDALFGIPGGPSPSHIISDVKMWKENIIRTLESKDQTGPEVDSPGAKFITALVIHACLIGSDPRFSDDVALRTISVVNDALAGKLLDYYTKMMEPSAATGTTQLQTYADEVMKEFQDSYDKQPPRASSSSAASSSSSSLSAPAARGGGGADMKNQTGSADGKLSVSDDDDGDDSAVVTSSKSQKAALSAAAASSGSTYGTWRSTASPMVAIENQMKPKGSFAMLLARRVMTAVSVLNLVDTIMRCAVSTHQTGSSAVVGKWLQVTPTRDGGDCQLLL